MGGTASSSFPAEEPHCDAFHEKPFVSAAGSTFPEGASAEPPNVLESSDRPESPAHQLRRGWECEQRGDEVSEVLRWYTLVAEAGDGDGCFYAGRFHELGCGKSVI